MTNSLLEKKFLDAAVRSDNETLIKCLKKGVDVNVKTDDEEEQPALHLAARFNHQETMRLLLANGVAIDLRKKNHSTPLDKAARRGNLKTVKLLIENKANINTQNGLSYHGHTPLCFAIYGTDATNKGPLPAEQKRAIIQELIKAKADVNLSREDGYTALHIASEMGYHETMR
jgi:ankyrin repeat protein